MKKTSRIIVFFLESCVLVTSSEKKRKETFTLVRSRLVFIKNCNYLLFLRGFIHINKIVTDIVLRGCTYEVSR